MDLRWRPQDEAFRTAPASKMEDWDCRSTLSARKVQKADREKVRRDKLNEQFQELGSALDPDRPRNDKATILGDTIQIIKDLTAQVNELKSEYGMLYEESCELTKERNELKEEKTALKSEVDKLNAQYQQKLRVMHPWAGVDFSAAMSPQPSYVYAVPFPIPSSAVALHPAVQMNPFFGIQTAGSNFTPSSLYRPYPLFPQAGDLSFQHSVNNQSLAASHQDYGSMSCIHPQEKGVKRNNDDSDVVTELHLKSPGSAVPVQSSVPDVKDSFSEARKKKKAWKHSPSVGEDCSCRCSSGEAHENSSSVEDGLVVDKHG